MTLAEVADMTTSAEQHPMAVDRGIFLPSLDLEFAERTLIREALIRAKGNRAEAAALLGMNLRTLQRRLASHPTLLHGFRTRLVVKEDAA